MSSPISNARRLFVVLAAVAAVAACSGLPFGGARRAPMAATPKPVNVADAARIISRYRAAHGLGPVRPDPRLIAFAAEQARVIARSGELSHGDFTSRASALDVEGAWENLSYGATSVADAIGQWRASPGHDANLRKAKATRIGLARADSDNAYWALVLAQ